MAGNKTGARKRIALPSATLDERIAASKGYCAALQSALSKPMGSAERASTKRELKGALTGLEAMERERALRPAATLPPALVGGDDDGARVSDHGVIRFMERALEFDVGALRAEILTEPVRQAIKAGMTRVPVKAGGFVTKDVTLVVTDGVVVTVLEREGA